MASERRFLEGLQQAVLMTENTVCNWPTHVSHGTRTLPPDIGPLRRNFSAFVTASCATHESRSSVCFHQSIGPERDESLAIGAIPGAAGGGY
jgi:hypothetical protein